MSSCREFVVAAMLLSAAAAVQAQPATYPGVGRAATASEVAAWDIDVRPDFKGLPKGTGSVAKGMQVWEGQCASCHGVFGESNEVFTPITGGTTAEDILSGRVARLTDPSFPGRSTLMKLSSLSTLWDYINRAMPWAQPKSLTPDEVYAVTAYVLNLGGVVPADFTLSHENVADVQMRLPNRHGTTLAHAMWPGAQARKRAPDVRAAACMKDCSSEPALTSFLPDHARNAHGNLAEQNRAVGAQVGVDTTRAAPEAGSSAGRAAAPSATPAATATDGASAAIALTKKHGCVACHGIDSKVLGPSFRDVAKRYAGMAEAVTVLAGKVKAGGSGVWGAIPMPPQSLGAADARAIAQWLAKDLK